MTRNLASSLSILLALVLTTVSCATVFGAIPSECIKLIPMIAENSVSTFLPSESALGQGLAVNIIYPEKPRYVDGAPVAIVICGTDNPNGLNFSMHAAQAGFIEIRFSFPGGGAGAFKSSGYNDYRGPNSQLALRDISLFAMGKLKDSHGKTISKLVPVKVNTKNIGVVGWSNGGNIALVTMDRYSEELKSIAWVSFYESPLGSLFFPPSLGSTSDLLLNKHYRQGSAAAGRCLIDFRKLAWDPGTMRNPGVHKKLGEPDLPGVLYFDENNNKEWNESTEFAFTYSLDHGVKKQFYPPEVTAAVERHKVFPPAWPSTVATLKESEAYFQERDGGVCIPSICSKYPQLLVTIFGSQVDHLQRQPDHPHIVLQYNSWLDNGAHWVRLNPEPIYLTQIANMAIRNFVSNPPNSPLDAEAIADHLEPEGMLKDYVFITAVIAELADRAYTHNLKSPLDEPLIKYTNGLAIPPLATPAASPQATPASINSTK